MTFNMHKEICEKCKHERFILYAKGTYHCSDKLGESVPLWIKGEFNIPKWCCFKLEHLMVENMMGRIKE